MEPINTSDGTIPASYYDYYESEQNLVDFANEKIIDQPLFSGNRDAFFSSFQYKRILQEANEKSDLELRCRQAFWISSFCRIALERGVNPQSILPQYQSLLNQVFNTEERFDIHDLIECIFNEIQKSWIQEIDDVRIQKAIIYIYRHCHEKISRDQLANLLGMDPAYFSSLFKAKTNRNFIDYVLHVKIEEAKTLIRFLDYSEEELTRSLCFSNKPYFCQCFQKVAHCSVMDYRNFLLKNEYPVPQADYTGCLIDFQKEIRIINAFIRNDKENLFQLLNEYSDFLIRNTGSEIYALLISILFTSIGQFCYQNGIIESLVTDNTYRLMPLDRMVSEKEAAVSLNNLMDLFQKTHYNCYRYSDLQKIIKYISGNINSELNVESIAEEFNLSQSHLSRRFKAAIHMDLSSYIRYVKIQRSRFLLMQTNLSVSQIGIRLFSSESHFCHCFKKEMGCSPKVYRQKYKRYLEEPYTQPFY